MGKSNDIMKKLELYANDLIDSGVTKPVIALTKAEAEELMQWCEQSKHMDLPLAKEIIFGPQPHLSFNAESSRGVFECTVHKLWMDGGRMHLDTVLEQQVSLEKYDETVPRPLPAHSR